MRAVEILGGSNELFFGSDDHGNLFSLGRSPIAAASPSEEKGKLEGRSEFHIAEYVNFMVRHPSVHFLP